MIKQLPAGVQSPKKRRCFASGRRNLYSSGSYPTAPDIESQKFTGKERDAETGLDYFGARYFSAAQGRFTSADEPFEGQHAENPQSWNLYSYALNNPLVLTDPDGREPLSSRSTVALQRAIPLIRRRLRRAR